MKSRKHPIICRNGHDTRVDGRYGDGHCTVCHTISQKKPHLTRKELRAVIEKQYHSFCTYRYDIATHLPDYRLNVFKDRAFSGRYFEITGGV